MSRNQHTIRQGTSEKHWYFLAGYLGLAVVAIVGIGYLGIESGNTEVVGMGGGLLVFALAGVGLAVYPSLFKDSAYLRGTRQWSPEWWKYIAVGLGTPIIVYIAFTVTGIGYQTTAAFVSHGISAPAVAAYYLYQRHEFVGVP